MLVAVRRPAALRGEVAVPGDKSISHRALILNAVATGEARLRNLSPAADVQSTCGCLHRLGVDVTPDRVVGRGLHGLRPAAGPLDCGNSGTTMRLLAGLLAGQPFVTELTGDESLRRRPMDRVLEPLRRMGAQVSPAPLRVGGEPELHGIDYASPVASAQVKSAVLLAGLYARGETRFREPAGTRTHTELMLAAMGAPLTFDSTSGLRLAATSTLRPLDVEVPGDLSAAAFWLVAAALHPASELVIRAVSANPSRTHFLAVLGRAGITARRRAQPARGAEPVAGLTAGTATELRPLQISPAEAPLVIDELPILAVAATRLPGRTLITGAGELRMKESDRIAAMTAGLQRLGADVEALPDGFAVNGPTALQGARVDSRGDHRVAMALAVAGMLAEGVTEIEGAECADISDPGFWDQAERLGAIA